LNERETGSPGKTIQLNNEIDLFDSVGLENALGFIPLVIDYDQRIAFEFSPNLNSPSLKMKRKLKDGTMSRFPRLIIWYASSCRPQVE
jgi:hypothetical protein